MTEMIRNYNGFRDTVGFKCGCGLERCDRVFAIDRNPYELENCYVHILEDDEQLDVMEEMTWDDLRSRLLEACGRYKGNLKVQMAYVNVERDMWPQIDTWRKEMHE